MNQSNNNHDVIYAIKRYLPEYLDSHGWVVKRNENMQCPFPSCAHKHGDADPSASFVPGSDYTVIHCHVSDESWDILHFAHELEGLPVGPVPEFYTDTVPKLAEQFGIACDNQPLSPEDTERHNIYRAYADAAQIVQDHAHLVQDEIEARGWSFDEARQMGIGAVPGNTEFIRQMETHAWDRDYLEGIGLDAAYLFRENALLFTIYDENGRPIAFAARDSSGNYHNSRTTVLYEKKQTLFNLHRARKEDGPLWLVEGYADTVSMYLAGRPNVAGIGGTSLSDEHLSSLDRLGIHDIVLCFDGDEAGRNALDRAIETCTAFPQIDVSVVCLPDPEDPDDVIRRGGLEELDSYRPVSAFSYRLGRLSAKQIERDIIPEIARQTAPLQRAEMIREVHEHTGLPVEAVQEALDLYLSEPTDDAGDAPPVPSEAPKALPDIETSWRSVPEISDDSLTALAHAHDSIYQHQGHFVTVRDSRINYMTHPQMTHCMARAANYHNSKRSVAPPAGVVRDVLTGGPDHRFPSLNAVTSVPVFTDGILVVKPGYDPRSGIYLTDDLGTIAPINQSPTAGDIEKARKMLYEPYHDFPFEDEASAAHTVALTIEQYVRPMISGITPVYSMTASREGVCKTLTGQIAGELFLGREIELLAACTSEEEWRKRLLSTLKPQPSFVMFDNIRYPLSSAALASAITAGVFSDRDLGHSDNITIKVRCTWIINGINLRLSPELQRRAVWIRLNSKHKRTEFRHPDLWSWVRDHRKELVHAALTLVQAWISAGKPAWSPEPGTRTLGGFEAWCNVIGGILSVAGIPGFMTGSRPGDRPSRKTDEWKDLIDKWAEKHGSDRVGAKEIYPLLNGDGLAGSTRSLGRKLKKQVGRVIGEWKIVEERPAHRAAQYRLMHTNDTGGDADM